MAEASPAPRFQWLTRHIPTRETIHDYRLLRPFASHLTASVAVADQPAIGAARGGRRPVRRRHHPLDAHGHRRDPGDPGARQCRGCGGSVPGWSIRSRSHSCILPPIGSARGSLHHEGPLVDPADAERFSGELSRALFWIHHASGPIALGILTIAVAAAATGYAATALAWRFWSHRTAGASAVASKSS